MCHNKLLEEVLTEKENWADIERNAKFLLDADMPRSSAEVFRSFGFDVEDVRDIGLGSATEDEITNAIVVVELARYRRRSLVRDLNHDPKITPEEGIRRAVEWMKSIYHSEV